MPALEAMKSAIHPDANTSNQIKPVIVASDGSDTSLAAIRLADLIQQRSGCTIRVFSALEPLPIVVPPSDGMNFHVDWEKVREKGRRDTVTQQLEALNTGSNWPVDISFGHPCEAIAAYAREHNAGLIIAGSNKHGLIDRMLGEDTAVDIASISEIPLLIASSGIARLPQRIIVAMDLHPDTMQNLGQVLSIVADAKAVTCVHVQADDEFVRLNWPHYDSEYQFATSERFASVQKSLLSAGLKAHLVSVHGDAAKEITDFANRAEAELVTVGITRKPGKTKAIGGKIPQRVIRQAGCSVLIVPTLIRPAPGTRIPSATEVITDSRAWDSALREFTLRNAGRIGSLEVDDPEIGANVEARNYPLIGVDYDHRDDCLTIILGDVHGTERHLTRTIAKPKAISILNGKRGDAALCVTHNGGQTLMTF